MRNWKLWATTGWALFAISFVLPVISDDDVVEIFTGWDAMITVLENDDSVLATLSGVSNVLMLLALVMVWQPAWSRRLRWALVAAVPLNAQWLFRMEEPGQLSIGYYVWLVSFVMLAIAAFRRYHPEGSHLPSDPPLLA